MFESLKSLFSGTSGFDLASVIEQGAFLVDVRTPSEFKEGHVKGSINIPLDRILDNLDKFKGKNHILVFCRSGNRSAQAKFLLEQNGFANVINGGTWQSVNKYVKN